MNCDALQNCRAPSHITTAAVLCNGTVQPLGSHASDGETNCKMVIGKLLQVGSCCVGAVGVQR